MSVITTIYQNIADQPVTYTGLLGQTTSVTGFALSALPNVVETAQLPCRLLLPVDPTAGGQFAYLALGPLIAVTWQIVDLFLLAPEGQGRGLVTAAYDLVAYAGGYAELMRQFRAPTAQSMIQSFRAEQGTFEWPQGSGNHYYGVRMTLQVQEVLSG